MFTHINLHTGEMKRILVGLDWVDKGVAALRGVRSRIDTQCQTDSHCLCWKPENADTTTPAPDPSSSTRIQVYPQKKRPPQAQDISIIKAPTPPTPLHRHLASSQSLHHPPPPSTRLKSSKLIQRRIQVAGTIIIPEPHRRRQDRTLLVTLS